MTTALPNLATTAQEQFFEALDTVQDALLEGLKAASGTVKSVVPDELFRNLSVPGLDSIPGLDSVPTPSESIQIGFAFAEQLLARQRQFAEQVLAAVTPAK